MIKLFTSEGIRRKGYICGGKYHDKYCYLMTIGNNLNNSEEKVAGIAPGGPIKNFQPPV